MHFDPDLSEDQIRANLAEVRDAAGFRSLAPDAVLHHYTSVTGLRGILETGQLFMTHLGFLDDLDEVELGTRILEKELSEPTAGAGGIVKAALRKALEIRQPVDVFAACFCEDADLLPIWRTYANRGSGYALGFPGRSLSRDDRALFVPVTYGEAEAALHIRRVLEWAERGVVERLSNGAEEIDAWLTATVTSIATFLNLLTLSTKGKSFSYEKEWRILHMLWPRENESERRCGFRDVDGLLIPYVVSDLPKDSGGTLSICCIKYGPTLRDEAVDRSLKLFLSDLGLGHVGTSASAARLRR